MALICLTFRKLHILRAKSLKLHRDTSIVVQRAPLVKSPPQYLKALNSPPLDVSLSPQGQSTIASTPILVSGQCTVISRFASPD